MASQSRVIAVTTTATQLSSGKKSRLYSSTPVSCAVYVPSAGQTVYVGGPDVTPDNGFPIPAGGYLTPELAAGDDTLFAVVADGSQKVNVLFTGV